MPGIVYTQYVSVARVSQNDTIFILFQRGQDVRTDIRITTSVGEDVTITAVKSIRCNDDSSVAIVSIPFGLLHIDIFPRDRAIDIEYVDGSRSLGEQLDITTV